MLKLWLISIFLTLVSATGPIVSTDKGLIAGSFNLLSDGVNSQETAKFSGIPIGKPAVGNLQWQPSKPVSSWSGIKNTKQYKPACPQLDPSPAIPNESMDCHYANVEIRKNQLGSNNLVPAYFWIHGSSLIDNSPYTYGNESSLLLRANIGFISAAYRLNAYGFLADASLSARDVRGVSGNYGVTDIILSLKWVKRNARKFGIDPNRIVLLGQSSGCTMINLLYGAPEADDLFAGAICLSGSPKIDLTLEEAEEQHNERFIEYSRCAGKVGNQRKNCLLSLTTEEIREMVNNPDNLADYAKNAGGYPVKPTNPHGTDQTTWSIVDGVTVTRGFLEAMKQTDTRPLVQQNVVEETELVPGYGLDGVLTMNYTQFVAALALEPILKPVILPAFVPSHYTEAEVRLLFANIFTYATFICGTDKGTKNAAHNFNARVYRILVKQGLKRPFPNGFGDSLGSFHAMDYMAAMKVREFVFPFFRNGEKYTWDHPDDIQLGNTIADNWIEFIKTLKITGNGAKAAKVAGQPNGINTIVIENGQNNNYFNYSTTRCQALRAAGVKRSHWLTNSVLELAKHMSM